MTSARLNTSGMSWKRDCTSRVPSLISLLLLKQNEQQCSQPCSQSSPEECRLLNVRKIHPGTVRCDLIRLVGEQDERTGSVMKPSKTVPKNTMQARYDTIRLRIQLALTCVLVDHSAFRSDLIQKRSDHVRMWFRRPPCYSVHRRVLGCTVRPSCNHRSTKVHCVSGSTL